MLGFAHIPTGAAANKGFDIVEVKSKIVKSAVALTGDRLITRRWDATRDPVEQHGRKG